jgi:hypothetical protein
MVYSPFPQSVTGILAYQSIKIAVRLLVDGRRIIIRGIALDASLQCEAHATQIHKKGKIELGPTYQEASATATVPSAPTVHSIVADRLSTPPWRLYAIFTKSVASRSSPERHRLNLHLREYTRYPYSVLTAANQLC